MLTLMVCSGVVPDGFSLALFGAALSHVATPTVRLSVVAIGTALIAAGSTIGYFKLG